MLTKGIVVFLEMSIQLSIAVGVSKIEGLYRYFLQWHLGFFEKEYTPTYRGFETYYGFWNGKEDYWDHTSLEDVWGTDLRDNMEVKHSATPLSSQKYK